MDDINNSHDLESADTVEDLFEKICMIFRKLTLWTLNNVSKVLSACESITGHRSFKIYSQHNRRHLPRQSDPLTGRYSGCLECHIESDGSDLEKGFSLKCGRCQEVFCPGMEYGRS